MSLLEEENKLTDELNIRSILISNIKKIPPYNNFKSIKIINLPEVFDGTWILKRVLSKNCRRCLLLLSVPKASLATRILVASKAQGSVYL